MFSKKPAIWRVSEKSLPRTFSHKSFRASVCSRKRFETNGRNRCKRARISSRTCQPKSLRSTVQRRTTRRHTGRRRRPLRTTRERMQTSTWAEQKWRSNDTTWHSKSLNLTMPKTNMPINSKRATSCNCHIIKRHYHQYSTSCKSSTRSERKASKSSSSRRRTSSHKSRQSSPDASKESSKHRNQWKRRRIQSKW